MKRLVVLLVSGLAVAFAHADDALSGLWLTPDQRGQRLLSGGDPEAAARTFEDTRLRAYAQLKAGDYQAAAEGFAAFDDAEAHYNRGNALARAGDLEGALAAYQGALDLDPQHQDARHNRDLVASALQEQSPPPSSQNGQDQPRDEDGSSASSPDSSEGDQGNRRPSESKDRDPAQGSLEQSDKQAVGDQPDEEAPEPEREAAQRTSASTDNAQADVEQARRDVAPSVDPQRSERPGGQPRDPLSHREAHDDGSQERAGTPPIPADSYPEAEQELALEQWLRRVPDDPGGLLRRKFMIEHLMRQREAQR